MNEVMIEERVEKFLDLLEAITKQELSSTDRTLLKHCLKLLIQSVTGDHYRFKDERREEIKDEQK